MKKLMWVLAIFLLIGSVDAATIHGEVYSWDTLDFVDAIVTIDSEPLQQDVVRAGDEYRFDVPPGTYTVVGKSNDGLYEHSEEITVSGDGDFVLDLVLFDVFLEIPDPDLNNTELNGPETGDDDYIFLMLLGIVVVLMAILFFYKRRPKSKEDHIKKVEEEVLRTDEDLEKVLTIIKESGGRTTQKDIRKKMMPLSEAKVSLLITELEDKEVVKRIKKGRGNVIILVKK